MASRRQKGNQKFQEEPSKEAWHVLVDRLLQKDVIPPPKTFSKHQNIVTHLKAVERYLDSVHVTHGKSKVSALINTLDDSVQTELFSQFEFEENENNYEWITSTLISLYKRKASNISPLIHLLELRQKSDQSVQDFAKMLRIEMYQHWPSEKNEKKEEYLVSAFLNGLRNRNVSMAILAEKPNTLDVALNLVKKELKFASDSNNSESDFSALRHIQIDKNVLESLQDQINQLQQQIRALQNKLSANQTVLNSQTRFRPPIPNSYPSRRPFNPRFETRPKQIQNVNRPLIEQRTCFTCGKPGHISRNCDSRMNCFLCNQAGHIARNCPRQKYQKKQFLRQVNDASSETSIIRGSEENFQQDDDNQYFEENECYVIEKCRAKIPKLLSLKNNQNQNSTRRFSVNENLNAERWTNFILGHGAKPKENSRKICAPTLISKSNAEPAKNKPVVSGRCFGVGTNFFVDSGAEVNVVSHQFVQSLINQQFPVKFSPTNSRIQCANGSKMAVFGEAVLSLDIGGVRIAQKFTVVDNLFPKIIIGIRTMKAMGIRIDAATDCIYMGNNVKVPFISRVVPQSRIEVDSQCPENY